MKKRNNWNKLLKYKDIISGFWDENPFQIKR